MQHARVHLWHRADVGSYMGACVATINLVCFLHLPNAENQRKLTTRINMVLITIKRTLPTSVSSWLKKESLIWPDRKEKTKVFTDNVTLLKAKYPQGQKLTIEAC